jgi:hypothetical protein
MGSYRVRRYRREHIAFHTLVMDLDVFWAKLMRKIPPM